MPDSLIISRQWLAEELEHFALHVIPVGGDSSRTVHGTVADPEEVATVLANQLEARFRSELRKPPVILPPPYPSMDLEVSRIAGIVELIDAMIADDPRARVRVIDYLDSRYGGNS